MASSMPPASSEMPVAIKVVFPGKDEARKFKLPLRELGAGSLPNKLRSLLDIPSSQQVLFERFSDSSSTYVTLDSTIPSVYKQLYRAAKAKQKLKIRATTFENQSAEMSKSSESLPERLHKRCYVHPYISDPLKSEDDMHPTERVQPTGLGQLNNKSSATLVTAEKTSSENPQGTSPMSMDNSSKAYYWPMSHDSAFSGSAKSVFEKSQTETKEQMVKKADQDEAPVPQFFTYRENFLASHANITQKLESLRRGPEQKRSSPVSRYTIYCNQCKLTVHNAHWHCGICAAGDFDLCEDCVIKGKLCENDDHWLIKRFWKDGALIPSTTETIGPKKPAKAVYEEEKVPGAFTSDTKREDTHGELDASRTCNSCVRVFNETHFVTCLECEDYDLCVPCHVALKHGHHPSHSFAPASKEVKLTGLAHRLCAPGRNIQHCAICDGCDKNISGVRHKCLNCPDFDYCSTCVKGASTTHPGHRLLPIYEPIAIKPRSNHQHAGIICDGPLCKGKESYIVGDRYKCAVCHNTDFCANCEALPKNEHNRTHPLIKFKTPVRNVSVTTLGEKPNGEPMRTMGDKAPMNVLRQSSKSTETTPAAPSANAATQVQTVAEVKPTEAGYGEQKVGTDASAASPELKAIFVRDMIPDGSIMRPSQRFCQSWTLRNPGPQAWPKGCCVCYIGGDSMLDIDPCHPSHVDQMYKATKSNTIERAVEVGEEVEFNVYLRTPERKGKAISYWRLKDATGLPFGHKLWCDVEVRSPETVAKAEDQVKTEHVEDISKHATVEDEDSEERENKMIFPKLDKESPVSSAHEAEAMAAAAPVAPLGTEDKEMLEDVESLELDDETDSDEGFLTDEEYELIASDDEERETAKNGKK